MFDRIIPDVTLKTRVRDEAVEGSNPFRWQDLKVRNEFAGRKVVLLSLPGAFTPTCSNEQLPGFERLHITIQNKVATQVSRALQVELAHMFEPRDFRFVALAMHIYRGGAWEAAGRWSFRGRG